MEPLTIDSVEKLYAVAVHGSGQSATCGQVLLHVHTYQGGIKISDLRGIDSNLRTAALYLITLLAYGKCPEKGILTRAQVERLQKLQPSEVTLEV